MILMKTTKAELLADRKKYTEMLREILIDKAEWRNNGLHGSYSLVVQKEREIRNRLEEAKNALADLRKCT